MRKSRKAVRRSVLSAAALLASIAFAGEPARPVRSQKTVATEATLPRPIEWTPNNGASVTIDESIQHARDKHGLAIHWDADSLIRMNGEGHGPFTALGTPGTHPVLVWKDGPQSPHLQAYSPVVPAHLQQHVTSFPTATR